MTVPDTKQRILETALRLLGEGGLERFSLRSVTAEAGVNLAAVNYHFGSKTGLLRALIQHVFADVRIRQLAALDELELTEASPTIEWLLLAYATPIFDLFDAPHGREWGRVWMAVRETDPTDRDPPPMLYQETEVTRRYVAAFQRVLPNLTPDELAWRFGRVSNLLMANQGKRGSTFRTSSELEIPVDTERRWLIRFLSGGLASTGCETPLSRG